MKTNNSLALSSETALLEHAKPIFMRTVGSQSSGIYASASEKAEEQALSRMKVCKPFSAAAVASAR
eukprot:8743733-Pyramimonas_sp.AAC.1